MSARSEKVLSWQMVIVFREVLNAKFAAERNATYTSY
ncbi:hypothetical protein PR003_g13615 [Phytophthora rubi]|uniref:Uncharacterized protein n=1 Tax=Phytophthora rubi TaxID=129364 RepID=A0A6A4EX18_9STRA|nr:hypothetical protein PR001_g12700 [Phytophthora rubi]KAE9029695.1 hypothetical protein PR002_g10069 [Phytophthora rubi]KAE9334240.1 hypothetical protein PR003_g13615 [Phytophthora rubi]